MPVLVTGAEGAVGAAAARALLTAGGEVRVYLDEERSGPADIEDRRRAGCKVARGSTDDEGRIEQALEHAHTVAHLDSSMLQDPARMLDNLAVVLSAAIGAGCRRFIWTSQLCAGDPRGNAYLKACAEGEQLLAAAPLETVVFRCALTYGPRDQLTAALAGGAIIGESARHAPLWVDDVADAVLAADRMDRAGGGALDLHMVVELAGPEVVTLDQFVRLLAARRRPRAGQPGVPAHVADLLRRDQPRTEAMLGSDGTPLAAGTAQIGAA